MSRVCAIVRSHTVALGICFWTLLAICNYTEEVSEKTWKCSDSYNDASHVKFA